MEIFTNDIIILLQYLLPGFVAAWMFYSLTSYPKPSQFERVVQALIFTIVIQALVVGIVWVCAEDQLDGIPQDLGVVGSVLTAIVLGVLLAFFANNDHLHNILRKLGITRETSYPSEWFGVFLNDITFVVLHLEDERRLYGWPLDWPSQPTKGHFVIAEPSWLNDDGTEIEVTGVSKMVIRANDVKWVEFLEKSWE